MKVVFCMLATLVAMVAAGGKAKGHKHGYDRSPYDPNDQLGLVPSAKGITAPYRNADRQKAVNRVAHKYGTGTGTAYKDGVAGAGSVYLHNYGQHAPHYGYAGHHGHHGGHGGHSGHGGHHGGHGHGGYGHNDGYGHGGYGHGHGHGHHGYGYANQDGHATRNAYNRGHFGPDSYQRHGYGHSHGHSHGHGHGGYGHGHGGYGHSHGGYGHSNRDGHLTHAAYNHGSYH